MKIKSLSEIIIQELPSKGNGDYFDDLQAQVRKSVDSPPGMLTEDHHHTVH